MATIGRLYDRLYDICCRSLIAGIGCYGEEDVFHETVLFVSQDVSAARQRNDTDFIDYFRYRFQMIKYQITMDTRQLRETSYADDIQAQKGFPEE